MREFEPVREAANAPGERLRFGRAEPCATNSAYQGTALAGCPLGREASAARPAPDLPPGKALHASPRSGEGLVVREVTGVPTISAIVDLSAQLFYNFEMMGGLLVPRRNPNSSTLNGLRSM